MAKKYHTYIYIKKLKIILHNFDYLHAIMCISLIPAIFFYSDQRVEIVFNPLTFPKKGGGFIIVANLILHCTCTIGSI